MVNAGRLVASAASLALQPAPSVTAVSATMRPKFTVGLFTQACTAATPQN
jgi:hypothetical protein